MTFDPVIEQARESLFKRFTWEKGHADVWRIFLDGSTFAAIVAGLAEPWRAAGITHVAGIESRGFLLGGAVANELAAGFQAIRKAGGMLPDPKIGTTTALNYRGLSHNLYMQDALSADDLVLLVDDWAEKGSQAAGARDLIEQSGARFAGVSLLVDQLDDSMRLKLRRVTSLVRAEELGDSDAK